MSTIHQVRNLVDLGFSVIPLKYKEKIPFVGSWQPFTINRPSMEQIERWFGSEPRNVGIVTGEISNVVVLDVDGEEGEASLKALIGLFGDLPPTLEAITGKGRHFYFKYPTGFDIRNRADAKLKIDIRGNNGYIVAPPSVHPSGSVYQWANIQDPAELPKWLFSWIRSTSPPDWMPDILETLGRSEKKESLHINENIKKDTYGNFEIQKYKNSAGMILKNCAFVQHCKSEAETLSEPAWHAMVTNVGRAEGGSDLVHELSKDHPGYSKKETDAKIHRALERGEPHTCEYIQGRIGFTGCPAGGCGVKAPVVFATSEIHAAKDTIVTLIQRDDLTHQMIYENDVLGALAVIKKRDPAEWSVTKNKLKSTCKELNLRDLDQAVKMKQADMQQIKIAERVEMSQKESETMTVDFGFPVTQPENWIIRQSGIYKLGDDGDTRVCPVPVFLTKRVVNADTGEEKVEITFKRDGQWRKINAARGVAFNRSQIVTLSNHSLPVTSENARELISYLSDFESFNLDVVPISKAVTRMGWINSTSFLPGVSQEIELDIDPGMQSIASGYSPTGDLSEWIRCMTEVRKHPLARIMMAASFAAPLLRLVGHRVFLLHVWGPSRGGKTAALKAALSVWGDPDAIMASFNTTRVGLERLAAFYSDLPLGIDERQIAGNKQDFIENLVYLIGMGKGKTRGAKGGGLQSAQSWRTIALTTGEEPLSSESSNTGIRTRAVELYGQPFSDETVAANVHAVTRDHHGIAGPVFIQKLIKAYEKNSDQFKVSHQLFSSEIQNKFPKHMGATTSQLAILALGDFIASMDLFGVSIKQAFEDSLQLIFELGKQLETDAEADEAIKGASLLMSWCLSNKNTFDENVISRSGMIFEGCFYIYSHKFDQIMKELNFNPARMLRDWSKLGFIKTQTDGDRVRFRIKRWDNQSHVMANFIAFNGPKESKKDDFE